MNKAKRIKIEKIEEEDEANSSMNQSFKSDEKKNDSKKNGDEDREIDRHTSRSNAKEPIQLQVKELPIKVDGNTFLEEVQTLKKRSKSISNSESPIQTNFSSKKELAEKEIPEEDTGLSDKFSKSQPIQKISLQSRKGNPLNSYKVNSVSLLNMLQNKTISLIKNVSLKE